MAWVETRPAGDADITWMRAGVSDDGSTILLGSGFGATTGRLWLSTNRGVSWTEQRPNGYDGGRLWMAVAVSGNGQVLIAGEFDTTGRIYRSTNGGSSWAEIQPAGDADRRWLRAALDYDGSVIMAFRYQYYVYISSDSGVNWSYDAAIASTNISIDCSNDGAIMILGLNPGKMYISTNTGGSFSEVQPVVGDSNEEWNTSAINSDGSVLGCGSYYPSAAVLKPYYLSTNLGANWTAQDPPDSAWYDSAIASNGLDIIASNYKRVYRTTNGGTIWTDANPDGSDTDRGWRVAQISQDGTLAIAAYSSGRVWIEDTGGTPAHKVADTITVVANTPVIGYSSIHIPTAAIQISAKAASIREGKALSRTFPTIEAYRSFPVLLREFPV